MNEQKIITYLKSLVHLEPDKNWFLSARDNLVTHMKHSPSSQSPLGWEKFMFLRNMKFATAALLIILVFTIGAGSVFASQESLPGELLFPVKLFTEEVEKFLARDEAKKVELSIKFADRRLQEVVVLSARPQTQDAGGNEIEKNLERFRVEIRDGEHNLAKIDVKEKKDEMTLKLVLKFEEGLDKHQEIFAGLEEVFPAGPVREAIRLAREASERGEAVSFKMALKIEGPEEEDEEEGDEENENEEKPVGGIERLRGKIGAASHKISEVEQKINREQERSGEAFVVPAKEKLAEAKKLLTDLESFLAGTPSPAELEEAFRKAQEVIRIAEDAKHLLDDDNRGRREERNIEVEVKNGKAEVKIERGENKSKFTLNTATRDEIVAKIIEVTGLSREEVEDVMKFRVDKEDEEEIDTEENHEENGGNENDKEEEHENSQGGNGNEGSGGGDS